MGKGATNASKNKNKNKVQKKKLAAFKKPSGTVKLCPKKKLKSGTVATYGDLLKTTGDGTSDRDHIPSYKALEKRARMLNSNKALSPAQKARVKKAGMAIVLSKNIHKQGRTYGGKNTAVQSDSDANDLSGAAKRDIKAYQGVGGTSQFIPGMQTMVKSNGDYDKMLKNCLK